MKNYILPRIDLYPPIDLARTTKENLLRLIQEKFDYLAPNIEARKKARKAIEDKNHRAKDQITKDRGLILASTARNEDRNTPKKPFLLHLNDDDKSAMDETAAYYGLSASEFLRILIRVTNLQIPLVAAFFDPSSAHFSVVEQARKQKQGLACNQRYVAPALLSAPTEVLIALTKSDEELKNYRFLTKDAEGRAINLTLVQELEKVPVEDRESRAIECFTMQKTIQAITNAINDTPSDKIPKEYLESEDPCDERDEEDFDYGSVMDLTEHIYPHIDNESEVDFI
jgi:hypothetical protein